MIAKLPRWHWMVLGCVASAGVALVSYDWLTHRETYRQLLSTLGVVATVLLFALLTSAALAFIRPSPGVAVPVYVAALLLCLFLVGTSSALFVEPLVLRLLGPPLHAPAHQ